jgi:hypothetical protein
MAAVLAAGCAILGCCWSRPTIYSVDVGMMCEQVSIRPFKPHLMGKKHTSAKDATWQTTVVPLIDTGTQATQKNATPHNNTTTSQRLLLDTFDNLR